MQDKTTGTFYVRRFLKYTWTAIAYYLQLRRTYTPIMYFFTLFFSQIISICCWMTRSVVSISHQQHHIREKYHQIKLNPVKMRKLHKRAIIIIALNFLKYAFYQIDNNKEWQICNVHAFLLRCSFPSVPTAKPSHRGISRDRHAALFAVLIPTSEQLLLELYRNTIVLVYSLWSGQSPNNGSYKRHFLNWEFWHRKIYIFYWKLFLCSLNIFNFPKGWLMKNKQWISCTNTCL